MKLLARLLFMFLKHQAKVRVLAQAKKTGTLAYLRAVRGVRRAMIGLLAAFMFLQFVVLAGFGALVTGVLVLDLDPQLKLQILFAVFLTVFFLPMFALALLFSERVWYRYSGAQKLVDDLKKDAA